MVDPTKNLQDDDGIQKEAAANVASTNNTTAHEIHANMNREMQDALGRRLQQVYGQLVAEPLPDKVMQLLAKLASGDSASDATAPRPKKSDEGDK